MILHIPHSSTFIPEEYLSDYTDKLKPFMKKKTDHFTDELFTHWNTDIVLFSYSRLFCDVERFQDDELEKIGQGVLYQKDDNGDVLRNISKAAKEEGLKLYKDHHALFNKKTSRALSFFPEIFIVDCHSFTPTAGDPDFCIGINSNYIEKELDTQNVYADIVKLLQKDYTVKINF